jgi:signal transduction histidine kinase
MAKAPKSIWRFFQELNPARRLQAVEAEARRLAEEKARLEGLDEAKRQFIRLVTHELQKPIAAIDNYLQLILEGRIPPGEIHSILEKSRSRAQEQMNLIADLLELGALQVLATPAGNEPVHLDRILIDVLEAVRPQAVQKNIAINLDVCPALPPLRGFRARFKSVWANLIDNAVKYTPRGGCVTVRLRMEDRWVVGQVSDTGIGIPQEEQKQIFTEFFRAANAKALEFAGTGLGLAIVKKIIEDAGGSITFESQPEKGTCFTFSVPAAPSPPARNSRERNAPVGA